MRRLLIALGVALTSPRVRLRLLACLLLVVALFGVWLLWPQTPEEALRRRVPLGADEDAVVAAVGRPPAAVFGKPGRPRAPDRRVMVWFLQSGQLQVELDEEGRSVNAVVHH
jgi:hypothetical protein